ncbi:phage integrase SAM-like domain-containing protein [Kaistella sp.]|uniref:phage integrase SAM-like domain-containing protein n=1 Tax=Kaistella sp. TaxID=2782235 RepID=UPI002F92E4EE
MATIRFFLKAIPTLNKGELTSAPQTVLFRYRPNANFDLTLATPYKINPLNWDAINQQWDTAQITKGAKLQDKKLLNEEIYRFNSGLSFFRKTVCDFIDSIGGNDANIQRQKIKDFVLKTYFANRIKVEVAINPYAMPEKFSDFIDYYLDFRSVEDKTKGTKPLAENTIKKYNTLKKLVESFRKNLLITDINDGFRNDFAKFLNRNGYAVNTQVKYIKDIKTLCKFASKELPISNEVLHWDIIPNSRIENVSEGVTLTFQQLKILSETTMINDYLENAKDWLLISCFSSVRISELFTFDIANIIEVGDDKYLKVTEKKNINSTGGKKIIYLLPQVVEIMEKRNGNFPRKISEQRYNEYIKKVCEMVGFTEPTQGAKTINIGTKKEPIYRKIKGTYPFNELISSHSGRKTYVTLFSEYLPTEILKIQTNHHSNEMVEHYNKTDETELMLRSAKLVANAHKEVRLKIV